MQFHHAAVLTECMNEWTEYVIQIAIELLKENNQYSTDVQNEFRTIGNFCLGSCHNPLGENRMNTNPEFILEYDVKKWLLNKKPLKYFKFSSPVNTIFTITDEQYKIIQDTLDVYGDSLVEKTKVLKMIAQHHLWRHPNYGIVEAYEDDSNGQITTIIENPAYPENTVFSV